MVLEANKKADWLPMTISSGQNPLDYSKDNPMDNSDPPHLVNFPSYVIILHAHFCKVTIAVIRGIFYIALARVTS